MATDYLKPMLDVGSPRVFNCNVLTRRIFAKDAKAASFFLNAPLNNLVLIKDTVPESEQVGARSSIGTKLYFPFNENDIYEGGRTIFYHDRNLERALNENFGQGSLKKEALERDIRVLSVLDKLPSLDPFLLKDVFAKEGIEVNVAYFEVSQEVWKAIEHFILVKFEPLVKAAFPQAMGSDEMARSLIQKIWEARDLEALNPLIMAFRLPKGEALDIFAAWKGINFYSYQYEKSKPLLIELFTWIKDLQIPFAAVSSSERNELKSTLEVVKSGLRSDWGLAEKILRDYQDGYDKMFVHKTSSTEFLTFLKNSNKAYWDLGNSLGKTGHASYCWDVITKRYTGRKLPYEPLKEVIQLLAKIFKPMKVSTSVAW